MQETETLEFKKSTSELKEALISIVSILNKHKKGKLLFGIKPNGEIVGQTATEKTIRDVAKTISDHIEPKIYPQVRKEKIENKDCIIVEFTGNDGPYSAYGRFYKRVADEDRQLSAMQLENLILEKNKEKMRWDTDICAKAKLSDISEEKLITFLEKSGKSFDGIESSFKKLNLMSDNKLLNAAVILFGKNPADFFPNARLRCAVFGTTNTSYIIDMQDYKDDIFNLIDQAENYILKNIHIGMKLDGLRRVDVPEINQKAFREAIINAFCHRDYWKYDSVNIAIFKDRLEIRSPGLLYGDLTINRIRKENVSVRRNELIADIFHDVHYVEKWGKGISLILDKEPNTQFKEVATLFITVFKRKTIEEATEESMEKTIPESSEEKWSEKLVEKLVEKVGRKLSENQVKILKLMLVNRYVSKKEISEKIGISTTAIDKNISKLKESGVLKRIGPDKGGHWEVIE
ncbi:MAG: putative DNA binding domain-containing protein [Candidatus Aenigmarchaeota archaeon]|nr:putative DNA binding domain-containing protein [Candidatus Aenigmarchaeota archaeon]